MMTLDDFIDDVDLPDWDGVVDFTKYDYITYTNGHEKLEGELTISWWCDSPERALEETLADFRVPDKAVMWRMKPDMLHIEDFDKHYYAIRMRIAVEK